MKQTTRKLVDELNTLKALCIEEILSKDIGDVDERGIKAMKSTLRVINLTNDLMMEQAEMMEDMNKKLDKLLERNNKGEV